ncbi:MAG: O-antigen ligase family protein [Candidatus Pacebacteria bacterium]|nr:O-antigen ligase family protein [Candidatus Paceibacterota bacterium]
MNLAKIDNILKYILFTAIFLVPFIPFIVYGNLFFPFITGKAFVFRILVEVMIGVWLILSLRNPEYRLKNSLILVFSAIFVALIGLSDFMGVNPLKSIWSNFERMEGWITLVHLLGYLVVVGSVLTSSKLWARFLNTSIVASVGLSLYGFMQLLGVLEVHQSDVRLDATFGNSAYFAVYLLVHIFLAIFLLVKRKGLNLVSYLYGLVIVLETVILYYTATRGAILGLLAGLMISAVIISLFEKENLKLKKTAIGGLVALVLFVGGFVLVKDSSFVQNSPVLKRFADISLQETTTKSRFLVWNMAFQGFKERPVLGWGQENFNYVFNKYYDPGLYAQEQWFDRTHNVFFDWLIAGGLLGLLGYLSLFVAILYYLIRDKNSHFSLIEKAVLIGLLAGYFVHNFFVFDNLISYILFFSLLAYLHSLNSGRILFNYDKAIGDKKYFVAMPVIVVVMFGSIYFVNTKGFLTSFHLLEALRPQGNINVNIENYQKALSYESFGNQEVREQLGQFAIQVASADTTTEIKQGVADFAFAEMLKEIERDPNNARTEVITGTLLSSFGAYDDALPHFMRAIELSPNKQSILFMVGTILQLQERGEEAQVYYKQAYELDKTFKEAAAYYSANAIRLGDQELADEILMEAYGTVLVDSPRIIQAYYDTKQYSKLIKILEFTVENRPNDLQNHLSLAASYLDIGNREKSIEVLQKAIEINPEFKEQGEYYINEIKAGRRP